MPDPVTPPEPRTDTAEFVALATPAGPEPGLDVERLAKALLPAIRNFVTGTYDGWDDNEAHTQRGDHVTPPEPRTDALRAALEEIANSYDSNDDCRWCRYDFGEGHGPHCAAAIATAALATPAGPEPGLREALEVTSGVLRSMTAVDQRVVVGEFISAINQALDEAESALQPTPSEETP